MGIKHAFTSAATQGSDASLVRKNDWNADHIYELDYVTVTGSNISITATTNTTANTVVTGNAVTYDGSTAVNVDYYAMAVQSPGAGNLMRFCLYDNGSLLTDTIGWVESYASPFFRVRLTPSAAAHTYSIRAYVASGTGTIWNSASTSSIRITRA